MSTVLVRVIVMIVPVILVSSQTQNAFGLFEGLFGPDYKTYENPTYNVKVEYPKDWEYHLDEIDKQVQPETIFSVFFTSPYESGNIQSGVNVNVGIDELKTSTTTLDQYKNRIMKNLKEATKDVKDVSVSPTTLDGEPAYRIEHAIWLLDHWAKSITIYSLKNGKLHEISALGVPEEIEKNSDSIERIFKSVKFN